MDYHSHHDWRVCHALFTNTKAHTAFFCAIALPNRAPVDNGMVYIDNVADDTKIEIKCAGNLSGIASVKKGGRLIPLPCVVIHIPNVH